MSEAERFREPVARAIQWWYANFDYDTVDDGEAIETTAEIERDGDGVQVFLRVRIEGKERQELLRLPLDADPDTISAHSLIRIVSAESAIQLGEPVSDESISWMLSKLGVFQAVKA